MVEGGDLTAAIEPLELRKELPFDKVNFHFWLPCNMRCTFCFAEHAETRALVPKGYLEQEGTVQVVNALVDAGFTAITFAGGEPTECPWLPELVGHAKDRGVVTSVITNGSLIKEGSLEAYEGKLDWLGLSVDSVLPAINVASGRAVAGRRAMTEDQYLLVIAMARSEGIKCKVNTVVNRLNYDTDMTEFILAAMPWRWKIMQMLPVEGQHQARAMKKLAIDAEQLAVFVQRNQRVKQHGVHMVVEDNDAMRGSYIMVDAAGRFVDNTAENEPYRYSDPILQVGAVAAMSQVQISRAKFKERDGDYNSGLPVGAVPAPDTGGASVRLQEAWSNQLTLYEDTKFTITKIEALPGLTIAESGEENQHFSGQLHPKIGGYSWYRGYTITSDDPTKPGSVYILDPWLEPTAPVPAVYASRDATPGLIRQAVEAYSEAVMARIGRAREHFTHLARLTAYGLG